MKTLDPKKNWKVVPLSKGQLLDVRKEDILNEGLYRSCDTKRGGGGYDQFSEICMKRLGWEAQHQFVVQLFGCNLDCPYCYVTREGVWGKYEQVSTVQLVNAFIESGLQVFHLMGGAPALSISRWPELIGELTRRHISLQSLRSRKWVFHSDMMLTEINYSSNALQYLKCARDHVLIAVNIKGYDDAEWMFNTRKHPNWQRFNRNLRMLSFTGVPFYITFTNVSQKNIRRFWVENQHLSSIESFDIELIDYNAIRHVDDVPWGGERSRL